MAHYLLEDMEFDLAEEYGQVATPMDAVREFATNVGGYDRWKDSQWILHDLDYWVLNPHYHGPPQRHPEEDPEYD